MSDGGQELGQTVSPVPRGRRRRPRLEKAELRALVEELDLPGGGARLEPPGEVSALPALALPGRDSSGYLLATLM